MRCNYYGNFYFRQENKIISFFHFNDSLFCLIHLNISYAYSTHELMKAPGNRNRLHTPTMSYLARNMANHNLRTEIIKNEKVKKISMYVEILVYSETPPNACHLLEEFI